MVKEKEKEKENVVKEKLNVEPSVGWMQQENEVWTPQDWARRGGTMAWEMPR